MITLILRPVPWYEEGIIMAMCTCGTFIVFLLLQNRDYKSTSSSSDNCSCDQISFLAKSLLTSTTEALYGPPHQSSKPFCEVIHGYAAR